MRTRRVCCMQVPGRPAARAPTHRAVRMGVCDRAGATAATPILFVDETVKGRVVDTPSPINSTARIGYQLNNSQNLIVRVY